MFAFRIAVSTLIILSGSSISLVTVAETLKAGVLKKKASYRRSDGDRKAKKNS